jgi:hypothetical protein
VIKPRPAHPSNEDMTTLSRESCPTDEEVAGYLDDTLGPTARASVAAHLVTCDACRAEVSDSASALDTYKPARSRRRFVFSGGVAAAAVLALLLARPGDITWNGASIERAPVPVPASEDVPRFEAYAPADGAAVDAAALAFSWAPLSDGTVYQLTISDERGTVVWQTRTAEATLRPTDDVVAALQRGARHFWRVEALLPDLRVATTGVHAFRVRAP